MTIKMFLQYAWEKEIIHAIAFFAFLPIFSIGGIWFAFTSIVTVLWYCVWYDVKEDYSKWMKIKSKKSKG